MAPLTNVAHVHKALTRKTSTSTAQYNPNAGQLQIQATNAAVFIHNSTAKWSAYLASMVSLYPPLTFQGQ